MRTLFLFFALFACSFALVPGKWFDRILIVNFENFGILKTLQHSYFKYLATQKGSLLSNYYAITHPSQPNYLTQIAGDYFGKNTDDNVDIEATTIVDLLERKHISWKSYQEDYPGNCFTGTHYNRKYYRKHNPFLSFNNIRTNGTRCAKIVKSEQLAADIASQSLPQYMYYTPNIDNDGHDTGLAYANKYLSTFMPPLLESNFLNRTLIVITFDEDDYTEKNHIYTALVGSMIPSGKTDDNKYTHYDLLRTVEDNWSLGTLGRNDEKATAYKILSNPKDELVRDQLLKWK
jgi:phospholipase C